LKQKKTSKNNDKLALATLAAGSGAAPATTATAGGPPKVEELAENVAEGVHRLLDAVLGDRLFYYILRLFAFLFSLF
jgi:hypothetical protein